MDDTTVKAKMLSVQRAIAKVMDAAEPLRGVETVPLTDALGRVLAEDVLALVTVPPADNAAMDGYALCTADAIAHGGTLPVSGTVPAGAEPGRLQPGTAVRIFTGAPIPAGADTVVMQEVCAREGDLVTLPADLHTGSHIRPAGEDVCAGDSILTAGMRLQPQDLALAASGGHAGLKVRPRLRVAVLATGDELVEPGQPLPPGKIYNSNSFALVGMLQNLGCQVQCRRIVADSLPVTMDALVEAAASTDLVITSGGVSVGDEDHVKQAVERLGSMDLWRVAIKPGKPLAMGRVGRTPFLGLPGNPVSLFVTFCLFGRPMVLRLQGVSEVLPQELLADADFSLRADQRTRYLRGRLNVDGPGMRVSLFPHQGSGVMSSTIWANVLVKVPAGTGVVPGDVVSVLRYSDLLH